MSRILSFTAVGALVISAVACTNTPDTSKRTVYRAHDTQVGSHIPRSYTDPDENASTTVASGAGQRAVGTSGVVTPVGTR